ncbi:hypothetical protein ASPZODRAFT_73783 [Penicilliopsis zonata CBS 506.65]|uniref:aminodeoxychorismate synthase n=1 Tax=Penicilliopsis zonata CBS 506.65 TaxID=1073090 RepID=A0A1L9S9F2_9EURO|nr:hypothetical protein ASPZODRAFT_73783 [Penicilliopsis zonata CBS 506.65]OJJ43801.1 hypothetical protein ASPZODRAFT_73783 [Penicilliopsis zonata CBS 506.65]
MAPLLGTWDDASPGGAVASSSGYEDSTQGNILYVDAYDSFSYNVVAMIEDNLNAKVTVLTIDSEWPNGNMKGFLQQFDAVVLGPGPGHPENPQDVGIMRDFWSLEEPDLVPVLGICLGFQSLCLHHGVSVDRLPFPLHGQVRQVVTTGKDIFENMNSLDVTLYHSLYARMGGFAEEVPDLNILAWLFLDDETLSATKQVPMAVRHSRKPFWGVQFHPESCKSDTQACQRLIRRWWENSVLFNKKTGRTVQRDRLADPVVSSNGVHTLPDVARTMLDWSTSSSTRSASRVLDTESLNAEIVNEHLNVPGSPNVLFQSNGRYSVISVPSPGSWRLEYTAQSEKLLLEQLPSGHRTENDPDPHSDRAEAVLSVSQFWDSLRYLMEVKKVDVGPGSLPFWGGFLGYFSYEMGLACLAHPKTSPDLLSHDEDAPGPAKSVFEDPPDASLLWTERSIVLDNETLKITIQSTRSSDDLPGGWLDQVSQLLTELSRNHDSLNTKKEDVADTEFLDSLLQQSTTDFPNKEVYRQQFDACMAELKAGESYELCLTTETSVVFQTPEKDQSALPWKLYKRLRGYNPATFSAYANLGNVKVISSSPECFLNWDRHSTLEMKPMKGTVRKTADMTLDKAKEILSSTKEMAENLMIADLIRHDLYGICGSGRVQVKKLLEVEDHGRVYQMITHVKGEVDHRTPGVSVRDMPQLRTPTMSVHGLTALQKCLPPGSMTGAPKERSCMHLCHIENRKRGIFSGVMGFLDLGGAGSFSVLIRTGFTCTNDNCDSQVWRIGAGGAITVLSTVDGEWEEMLTKLQTVRNIFSPSSNARDITSQV